MTINEPKVKIDGVEFALSSLSDEAKAQINNLQFVDAEIARLNAQLAIAGTAKMAYQVALKNALPGAKRASTTKTTPAGKAVGEKAPAKKTAAKK